MNRVHKFDYRVVTEFLIALDCPRALTVEILFRYGEFSQIVNLSFDPFSYNNCEDARNALQATEFLRKHEDLPTNIDKSSVAFTGFHKAEEVCRVTNERIFKSKTCAKYLLGISRQINRVLRDFDANEFLDSSGWGPGSTLGIRRRDATPANKFRSESELTQPLFTLIKPWFESQFPHWPLRPRIVGANKVITVPKNAKTDRIIAVEPSLNLYFQKGIGAMIRRRLRFLDVDLNDQTRNQFLAQVGSSTNRLATVDFSAASDTISSELIRQVLPSQWLKVLEILRSPRGLLSDGSQIEYAKFSSMGNGYTFELESLIFWATAKCVVPKDHPDYHNISVYGDDVIIPSEYVAEYELVCNEIGFTVNRTKSYASSYYRESCGKHYWGGTDITPIYCRRFLLKEEIMRLHNRVVELSRRSIAVGFRDKRFRSVISILANASPIKARIPEGYGDLGLISSFDEVTPVFNRRLFRGWVAKAWIPLPSKRYEDDEGVHLMHLYLGFKRSQMIGECDSLPFGNDIPLPSRVKYKYKTLCFTDWPCLGPWI